MSDRLYVNFWIFFAIVLNAHTQQVLVVVEPSWGSRSDNVLNTPPCEGDFGWSGMSVCASPKTIAKKIPQEMVLQLNIHFHSYYFSPPMILLQVLFSWFGASLAHCVSRCSLCAFKTKSNLLTSNHNQALPKVALAKSTSNSNCSPCCECKWKCGPFQSFKCDVIIKISSVGCCGFSWKKMYLWKVDMKTKTQEKVKKMGYRAPR